MKPRLFFLLPQASKVWWALAFSLFACSFAARPVFANQCTPEENTANAALARLTNTGDSLLSNISRANLDLAKDRCDRLPNIYSETKEALEAVFRSSLVSKIPIGHPKFRDWLNDFDRSRIELCGRVILGDLPAIPTEKITNFKNSLDPLKNELPTACTPSAGGSASGGTVGSGNKTQDDVSARKEINVRTRPADAVPSDGSGNAPEKSAN